MKRTYVVFGLVFVILAGLLYIALRFDFDENVQGIFSDGGDSVESGNGDIIISRPDGFVGSGSSSGEDEETGGGEAGGAGAGGSGGAASSDDSLNDEEQDYCQQTIAYTLLDFSKSEDCLVYEGADCVQKFVNCTVSVQNLDYRVGGDFSVRFDFKDVSNGEIISFLTQTQFIDPRAVIEFSRQQQFEGENASRSIDCGFSTESAPTWVVC